MELSLSNVTPHGSLGTPNNVSLNILNDDPLPVISVNDVTFTEVDSGTAPANFVVTRTGLTDRAVSFTVRTADGTAIANEDYFPVAGSRFSMSPNTTSMQVSVFIIGDTITEPDEGLSLIISEPDNATLGDAQGEATIKDNETSIGVPTVQFGAREFRVGEGAGRASLVVTRSGDLSSPFSVSYATGFAGAGNTVASERSDYTISLGTLRFAPGEASKTLSVFITDDVHVETDEFLSVALSSPTNGVALGNPSSSLVRILNNDAAPGAANPIDGTAFFVRQHYLDFLGREPDAGGLAFWSNEIESCGADQQCRSSSAENVSAAVFLSIEFQQTGYSSTSSTRPLSTLASGCR